MRTDPRPAAPAASTTRREDRATADAAAGRRTRRATLFVLVPLLAAACQHPTAGTMNEPASVFDGDDAPILASAAAAGLVRRDVPAEDPGPPFYARVTRILEQYFHHDGWLAIPFYRDPDCIPADFDMLGFFDPPGEDGPGAFRCPILMRGFTLIEPDAPIGTFPRHAILRGHAVPFWFVRWDEFLAAAADGTITIGELRALQPLRGVATNYHESLRPREGDHHIVINAHGTLEDGRAFNVHITHIEDASRSVRIRFR